eukprot:TRINITY_DN18020_c0_g1_i1.p1 TRINITY_DN18020_c0_g1~~TRINITY_DN18020_c0_g1_i1.p1  ORF type:complete len:162 (+),score=28.02 TRINITY_DN18020_c0_g1_i1:369-854(+)
MMTLMAVLVLTRFICILAQASPLFEIVLEDKMALPPGVVGADLFENSGFHRQVQRQISAAVVLTQGFVRMGEVKLTNVTVEEDTNAMGENPMGGVYYGTKRVKCIALLIPNSIDLQKGLQNIIDRSAALSVDPVIPLSGAAPWRKIRLFNVPEDTVNPFIR